VPNLPRLRGAAAVFAAALIAVPLACIPPAGAQPCNDEGPIQNYSVGISGVCPCFVSGEEAGAVFNVPAAHYPIQILTVGIGWASQYGGAPQQIEEAINVYGAGLPNPGTAIASLPGPVLSDGFINQFDLEAQLGQVMVPSGPFAVTLQFLNDNSGDIFAPTVGFDGDGCQAGKNVVKAIPGGWLDACALGVSGDWVFFITYRHCDQVGVEDETIASRPAFLMPPRPNPATFSTDIEYFLAAEAHVTISAYDVSGRRVAVLEDGDRGSGRHVVRWDTGEGGSALSPGTYFIELRAGSARSVRKLVLAR
jgi:hypothetical protein